MRQPPVPGVHGRHRPLGTPGPIGCNDHGDPYHGCRQGATPGPVGDNDHGTPLSTRLKLILEPHDNEVAKKIGDTIHQINSEFAAKGIAAKLLSSLAAVRQHDESPGLLEMKSRYAELYFYARLLTFEGKLDILRDAGDSWTVSARAGLRTPAVEYRQMGEFFSSPVRAPSMAAKAALRLSYHRLGQSAVANQRAGEADHSSYWFEKGRSDGLRDRAVPEGALQTYL
jgi:hypothetical protein